MTQKQTVDLLQAVRRLAETARLDEMLAIMSRLAAPDVERLIESQLEEWRRAGTLEPAVKDRSDEDLVESEPVGDQRNVDVLRESLTAAIVERSKLTTDTEIQLADLLVVVALATGTWILALVLVVDLLGQDQLARRPTRVIVKESKRDWDVILEWDDEGAGWVTFVPALNNISTFGDTREEALARTHEAIRGYLTAAAKRGILIPEEQPRE